MHYADTLSSDQRVLIVGAGRQALADYRNYSAYICQPQRRFRACQRIAFYSENRIHRYVPLIEGSVERVSLSPKWFKVPPDLSSDHKERVAEIIATMSAANDRRIRAPAKILLLSAMDSESTLVLPREIENDTVSRTGVRGRRLPFVQSHRYVALHKLEECPSTTSALLGDGRLD
jgi:hypothetical protein